MDWNILKENYKIKMSVQKCLFKTKLSEKFYSFKVLIICEDRHDIITNTSEYYREDWSCT